MEIGNNDINSNTQTLDNTDKVVFHIDRAGDPTRNLRDHDTIKAYVQASWSSW